MDGANPLIVPDMVDANVFLAGQKVAPGRYRHVGSKRLIHLDREDTLPASLDGRVAEYIQEPKTWAEIKKG
jgi:hypothetical protein